VSLAPAPPPGDEEPPFDPWEDTQPRTPPRQDDPTGIQTAARDAELALLGHLLANPETAHKHLEVLDPADLAQPRHETIWHTLQAIADTDQLPDHPTVVAHLAQTKDALRLVGGHEYLLALRDHDPGIPQTEAWATTIRQAADARRLRSHLVGMLARLDTTSLDEIPHTLADLSDLADHAATNFGGTKTGPTQWAPLNLEEVLAGGEVDPPPAMLARDDGKFLLYDQAVHTISGEPGSGKTWLTLVACVQQLELGNPVCMLDFEDRASRVVGRLLALGARPEQVRELFRYVRPHTALDPAAGRDLDRAVHDCSLVILDGVTEAMTLHGFDLNANPDAARFYELLPRRIADQGPAVAMIDHVVKDTEKQGRWAIGAQHKLAGIDGVAYTVKAIEPFGRGKVGHARVSAGKDRAGHVEEILLGRTAAELWLDATNDLILKATLRAPTSIVRDDNGAMRPTRLMERVSRWLELQPNASRTAIEEGVTGKTAYVRKALEALIHESYVETEQGPRNTTHHRVITPYREDDDRYQEPGE
jgi:hypothetical protein